jgi:hypothetical protein
MLPENRSKENLSSSWLSQPRSQLLLLYAALPWIIQYWWLHPKLKIGVGYTNNSPLQHAYWLQLASIDLPPGLKR